MKVFFIAGERSGDLHGSYLVKQLRSHDPEIELAGYGGDQMEAAGMKLLSHYREGAYMGFIEVVRHLPTILSRISRCKKDIKSFMPDVLVMIDYPGFNLRMAAFAHELGIKTVYYISPKIWAWKKSRIKQIRDYVDRMLVIFPFEVPFYEQLNYKVDYVGNPIVEQLKDLKRTDDDKSKVISFLPGSRKQEVLSSKRVILELADRLPDWQFLVTAVDNLEPEVYDGLAERSNVSVVYGQTHECIERSNAAIVTSGTATLETALIGTPQVVCYKTSSISYWIGKKVVTLKYISLVNLIADQPIVTELIQNDYNVDNVMTHLDLLLNDKKTKEEMKKGYREVSSILGEGSASKNAASIILSQID